MYILNVPIKLYEENNLSNLSVAHRKNYYLKYVLLVFYFLLFTFYYSKANNIYFESPLEGRWDLTLYNSGKTFSCMAGSPPFRD